MMQCPWIQQKDTSSLFKLEWSQEQCQSSGMRNNCFGNKTSQQCWSISSSSHFEGPQIRSRGLQKCPATVVRAAACSFLSLAIWSSFNAASHGKHDALWVLIVIPSWGATLQMNMYVCSALAILSMIYIDRHVYIYTYIYIWVYIYTHILTIVYFIPQTALELNGVLNSC